MTTRTIPQNSAIHLYCEQLADALNDAGFEMKAVLAVKKVDVPWSKDSVKEVLWKPIMKAMFDIESTTQLDKLNVSDVYDVLDRHISENFGVHVPFPSDDNTGE